MIQYIVECIAFQLLFLIVYDLFLRRETFFQWNRVYLITTYVLSLLLPWIRVDAFKNTVPEHIMYYPEVWMDVNTAVNIATVEGLAEASTPISWWKVLFYAGTILALVLFLIKILQLYRLRRKGEITYFKDFTRVLVSKSNSAFSFFRTIFLGDQIQESERQSIVEHELVHIKQKHSLDLLFFEFFRITNWFNPLVYVYQSRISELHEFIADAQVAKTRKKEQYQLLLSQVFQTEKISFINHFFKSSLIKKRIVMLQKARSKKIWGAKYLLLVPMVLCILFYTSSKGQEKEVYQQEQIKPKTEPLYEVNNQAFRQEEESVEEKSTNENVISTIQQNSNEIPFSVVDNVPVFPGCEDAADKKKCFNEMLQKHIRQHFRYPREAQAKGIQGRVSIMFTIMEDGSISNIRMRGPNILLEKESARIIGKLPKMKAGVHKGKKVRVPFSVPITFKLQGDKELNKETSEYIGNRLQQLKEEIKNIDSNDKNNPEVAKRLDSITKLVEKSIKQLRKEAKEKEDYGDVVPFSVIDDVPVFLGCKDAADKKKCFNEMMQKHIAQHFKYPKEAQRQGVQGRVSVMFTIGKDGSIENIRKRGPSKILEQEAVRIIEELPKMKPGKHKGKNVKVPFSVPITFRLNDSKSKTDLAEAMLVTATSKTKNGKRYLSGKVANGELGLPGVNITIKGGNKSVTTNFDGEFTIEIKSGNIVSFQYLGFPKTALVITDKEEYKIKSYK